MKGQKQGNIRQAVYQPLGISHIVGDSSFSRESTDNCEGNAKGSSSSGSKVLRLTFLLSHWGGYKPLALYFWFRQPLASM